MNSYVLTTRGRIIIGALVLLLLTGLFLGVGTLLDSNPEASASPVLEGTQPPEDTGNDTQTPDTGTLSPEDTAEPEDTTEPEVSVTLPDGTESPSPTSGEATGTHPAEPSGSVPATPPPPSPPVTADTEKWYLSGATLIFEHNSADLVDAEEAKESLRVLLPADLNELRGYVVLVKGFKEPDEDTPDLAALRAETVSRLLVAMGVPESSIRPSEVTGVYAVKYRVEVSFLEVGEK